MWQLLIPAVTEILGKVIPDPQAQAEAKLKALEMAQAGEFKALEASVELAKGQMRVNEAEASTDVFRGGWRPFAGWCCGAGLAYEFLMRPILPWVVGLFGVQVDPMPPIDVDSLMVLLTGMLGLGGLRTMERMKGKA